MPYRSTELTSADTPSARVFADGLMGSILLGLILSLAGCSSPMAAIDRRINQAAEERANTLGSTHPPTLRPFNQSLSRRAKTDKNPHTRNPAATDLEYQGQTPDGRTPQEVARALSSTLEGYGMRAMGLDRDQVDTISLSDAFAIAQRNAREYRTAEEDFLLASISLLVERHLFDPRLFNDTSVTIDSNGSDGRFDSALRVVNTLRLSKQLPYGGQVEARWIANATEQLRSSVEGQYVQSSELVLSGNIPLLRGAGLIAQDSLIQSERDLVYAARSYERFRRTFYVSIAVDYFQLLQTLDEIRNQISQLRSLRLFEQQRRELYVAGRISEFDVNDAANRVLTAQSSLASRRESYALALDRFKIRLGIPVTEPLQLNGVKFLLDPPSASLEQATESALLYRLDLQTSADRVLDSSRSLDNAKNQLLPELNIGGEVRLPTDPNVREGGAALDPDQADLSANMALSLPLDRTNERLRVRQSQIRVQRAQRSYERDRDQIILEVRQRLRNIDLARFRLELAQRQVEINQRRQEEQRIKADEVDTNRRLDTESDLLNSKNARDQAATDLRIAILNYLLSAGRLRINATGHLEPLDGMKVEYTDTPVSYDELFGKTGSIEDLRQQIDQADLPDRQPTPPSGG